jgi:hypothetical protein
VSGLIEKQDVIGDSDLVHLSREYKST